MVPMGLAATSLRMRMGRTFGILLIVGGLARYVSHSNRAVLDRWSYAFASLLVIGLAAVVWSAIRGWQQRGSPWSLKSCAIDLAWTMVGLAYCLSAAEDEGNGGRLLAGDIFGSIAPFPAALEWASLAVVWGLIVSTAWEHLEAQGRRLALPLAAALLALLIAEGGVRLWTAFRPTTQGFPTKSTLAWERRFAKLNRDGFRGPERSLTARPGVSRLLIVGDSVAFGAGVDRVEKRFGEQLSARLEVETAYRWEVITAALPDTHTLEHLEFLETGLAYGPDVVILLYVFNDIDYLSPVTPRPAISSATGPLSALSPTHLAFRNSYLFNELYVRFVRAGFIGAGHTSEPYDTEGLMRQHVADIKRFTARAGSNGRVVGIVPYDLTTIVIEQRLARYQSFVARLEASQTPVWPIDGAFEGQRYEDLIVNHLDTHPNARANALAAEAALPFVLSALASARYGTEH